MAKFTFLEVHLDGAQLTANAPFSSGHSGESDDDESSGLDLDFGESEESEESANDESSGRSSLTKLLLVVAAVAVLVIGIRRLMGGSDEEIDRIEA